jgi:hypothetical protein
VAGLAAVAGFFAAGVLGVDCAEAGLDG